MQFGIDHVLVGVRHRLHHQRHDILRVVIFSKGGHECIT